LQGADAMGLALDEHQLDQLVQFGGLLEKWNKSFNLVSRQDISRLAARHLLDSLSAVPLLQGRRVMDLGSGAGLPGIPLSIAAPQVQFVLCDRSERRIRFLRQVIQSLELGNAEVWLGDYGQLKPPDVIFDTVVARGVATVAELWAMVHSQLAADGRLLVYESTRADPAEASHDTNRTQPESIQHCAISRHRFVIPGIEQVHSVVCVEHAE